MNLDANPPHAGEKTGVQSPAQKTSLPTTGTDPYAGLSLAQLMEKFADKPQEERLRLIREIRGMSQPEEKTQAPSPPDPPENLSALAKRLRGKIGETPGNDETAFETDIAAMRALFTDLLHNAGGREVDLKFGLTVALRAQKQALDAFIALRKLEILESKQNPPGWISKK